MELTDVLSLAGMLLPALDRSVPRIDVNGFAECCNGIVYDT